MDCNLRTEIAFNKLDSVFFEARLGLGNHEGFVTDNVRFQRKNVGISDIFGVGVGPHYEGQRVVRGGRRPGEFRLYFWEGYICEPKTCNRS
mgnify:CR=1 FL=1